MCFSRVVMKFIDSRRRSEDGRGNSRDILISSPRCFPSLAPNLNVFDTDWPIYFDRNVILG